MLVLTKSQIMKKIFTALFVMLFALGPVLAQPKIILYTQDDRDDQQYEFLVRNGFDVEKFYAGDALSAAGQDTIDKLNAADLVIVGRSPSSGTFDGDDKPVWNGLTTTVLFNSQWVVRSQRTGMVNSTSAWHGNDGPPVEYANVLVPGDPIFSTVTLDADSMAWMLPPHDYIGGGDSATNGTILATTMDGLSPLIVRWDADTPFFPGAADSAAGPRVYFGFGNDDIGPGRGNDATVNFFPLTRAGKEVYLNEINRILGLPQAAPVFGAEDVRVMMYTDFEADEEEYGQADDQEQINWLVNQGFYVTKFYAGDALSAAGQDTLDKMNMSVDVVVVGRSNSSGNFDGDDKPVWNALTVPVVINSQWVARSQRVGMINSTSAFHQNDGPAMVYAKAMDVNDPAFTGVTLDGDSVGWMLPPHDFIGGGDSATNGTIHAYAMTETQTSPLVVTWDGGTPYFPGSADTPAGPRAYFGFGNDDLRNQDLEMWPNDFPLTKAGKQVYLNVLNLLGGIDVAQWPTAAFTAADEVVTFYTDYEADLEGSDYGIYDDQAQVDWLKKNGVHVNLFYGGDALSAAGQDTIDYLNASDLVIVGRSNSSGNFDGDDKPVWNDITAPLIMNSQWVARSQRVGMINSTSAFHQNDGPEVQYAVAQDPASPAFSMVELSGDSVEFMLPPHDYIGGGDSATNGTIHAFANTETQKSPLVVTWDAGTPYFPGSADTPAGPRAYFGIGNDDLRNQGINYYPNDFPLTPEGQQIYLNVISLMLGAEMSAVTTVSSDAYLDSLTADVGTMEPEFDEEVMEYTLTLAEGETDVTLTGYPADFYAITIGDTAITGITDTLEIEVHVIAENFNEMIYTVTIYPFIDDEPDGIREASASSLKLYPNPANSLVYLESDQEIKRVAVFNIVGELVMERNGLNSSRIELSVDELNEGLYMIRVDNTEASSIVKFLKK